MVTPIAASSASPASGSILTSMTGSLGSGTAGGMPASVSGAASVTIPASATGSAAAAQAPGGFAGMISGLLNLPVGTNGHASANPIPPPLRIAMSAVSSLALGSPFGFASTLFMSFAEEILEMGPDTSRPPVPAGMSVTGQEQGVQPTSPGTLHDGAYLSLATTTPEFLAGTGPVPAAGASPGGQEADVSLGWLPGKPSTPAATGAASASSAADGAGAAATGQGGGQAEADQAGGVGTAQAGGAQGGNAATGSAIAATGTTSPGSVQGAAAAGIPGTVSVLVAGALPVAAAAGSAATVAGASAGAAGGAAPAAPGARTSGWMAAYAGMSEWQRAEAVEKGMV